MKIIGLTGGIGSGKTTVSIVFKKLGIPIYYSDKEAKLLMNSNKEIQQKLTSEFGKEVYTNNKLNRKLLSNIIFNNKQKLQIVNYIVHPVVRNHFKNWSLKQRSKYIINENAIIFESGMFKDSDKIICITAPEKIRIKRVMKRDNTSYEEVKSRIKNQISEQERAKRSDYIITNDNKQLILPQIIKIHENLLKL